MFIERRRVVDDNQTKREDDTTPELSAEGWGMLFGAFMLLAVGVFVKFGILIGLAFVVVVATLCWIGLFISNYRMARRDGQPRGWALLGAFVLTVFMWGG